MVQATFGHPRELSGGWGARRTSLRVQFMSSGSFGQHARQAAIASSVAALTAACSQSGDPPARAVAGDGSRASLSRSIFSESDYGVESSPRVARDNGPVPKGGGIYKLGSPYKVAGRWYVPREEPGYDREGRSSWYGDDFHGRKTANGEIFDMRALTAAHPTLPMPCYAYVTNLANGRTILVRVNDRGPYANDRIIDLSHASARALGYEGKGLADVRVRYAGRAPLNGDDRREHQYLAEQNWNRGNAGPVVAAVRPAFAPITGPQPFPAGTPGRWSPAAYRAALAGKPALPLPQPYAQNRDYVREASLQPTASLRTRSDVPVQLPWAVTGAVNGPATATRVGGPERAFVQVGVFRDRANAERLRRDLATLGAIEVAPVTGGSGLEHYRVRLGPMSATDALMRLGEVAARGVIGSSVVLE